MKNKIIEDIKSAMKSQDKVALAVVRMLKSDIQMAELNKKSELTDDEIVSIVSKQTPLVKGKADMGIVSKIVKEKLSNL